MAIVVMTLAEEIYDLVSRKSGLTEAEIARMIFGRHGYQQQVNSACRQLAEAGRVERQGKGGPGNPYTYRLLMKRRKLSPT
jgi:hypothetical protein